MHTVCPNCNTAIKPTHKFCNHCGQDLHTVKQPFKHFFIEFLESTVHFDNKIWRTLKTLFRNPGQVIKDYNDNKKARYVPPIRLYIFSSFIYFLLIAGGVEKNIEYIKTEMATPQTIRPETTFGVNFLTKTTIPYPIAEILLKRSNITEEYVDSVLTANTIKTDAINNKAVVRIVKLQNGEISPKELGHEFISAISKMVFILMPIFALIVLFVCGRTRLFYSETLVFSMYFHSFYIFLLIIGALLSFAIEIPYLQSFIFLLSAVYLFFSIRTAFGKPWLQTIGNTLAVLLIYSVVFIVFFTLFTISSIIM